MHVTYRCPRCESMNRAAAPAEETLSLSCTGCDWTRPPVAVQADQPPGQCLVCGNDDLWRQKDFPAALGVGCVALGVILSGIAWAYYLPNVAYGILMAFGLLDMVLYVVMPDVLVCYRCHARHGGFDMTGAEEFNLEISERYRQESIRLKQAAPKPAAASPATQSRPGPT